MIRLLRRSMRLRPTFRWDLLLAAIPGGFGLATILWPHSVELAHFSYAVGGFLIVVAIGCVVPRRVTEFSGGVLALAILVVGIRRYPPLIHAMADPLSPQAGQALAESAVFLTVCALPSAVFLWQARFGLRRRTPPDDPSKRWRPRERRASRGILFVAAGLALRLAAALTAVVAVVLGMQFRDPTFGILLVVFLWLLTVGNYFRRRGKEDLVESASVVLAKDRRPPVLYLRPFASDAADGAAKDWYPFQHWANMFRLDLYVYSTVEEHILKRLSDIGPVIALSDPRGRHRPIGFSYFYSEEHAWQADVTDLMHRAGVIVILLGGHHDRGLQWEVGKIAAANLLPKVVLILPVLEQDEGRPVWQDVWCDFVRRIRDASPRSPAWMAEEFTSGCRLRASIRLSKMDHSWCVRFSQDGHPLFRSDHRGLAALSRKVAMEVIQEQGTWRVS